MNSRWNHLLLGVLLLGHLILLSQHEHSRGTLLQAILLRAVGPVVHTVTSTSDSAQNFFDSLRLASSLREENQKLQQDLESMRRELVHLHGVEEELERLARISAYERFETERFFVADVVYIDSDSWLRTLVLYTGSEEARRNQPVVSAQGLVGRIIFSTRRYAKVLLLTDRSASVSAMIKRTRRRGMLRGGGGEALILDNIPLLTDVQKGDLVVTAGIDGVFPRGIPIGEVISVEPRPGLFHRIQVAPAVDFGHLDQVYVLTEETVPADIKSADASDALQQQEVSQPGILPPESTPPTPPADHPLASSGEEGQQSP